MIFLFEEIIYIPPYNLSGFDLTTHNPDGDNTTRPRRQGRIHFLF
jgi:hypothetical protein